MARKGFGSEWRSWVYGCPSSVHFLVILNGTPKGFFPTSRGLRQGDPPSPFLFMAADSLSQILKSAENNGLFEGFQMSNDKVNVSHLQFADDMLILMEGEEDKVPLLKSLIKCFELV